MDPAKTAESIEIPFGADRGGLDEARSDPPRGMGNFG